MKNHLKIAILSTKDRNGGAPNSTFRMFKALQSMNCQVNMITKKKQSFEKSVVKRDNVEVISDFDGSLKPYLTDRPEGLPPFSNIRTHVPLENEPVLKNADVINLRWVSRFLNYENFFRLYGHKPIVITLHDMNWFTGGCHYSLGCEKFKENCGSCPQLGSDSETDLSRKIWRYKKASLQDSNIHAVAPSRWMAKKAKESSLLAEFPVHTIANGVPTDIFYPRNNTLQEKLSINSDKKVLLFTAMNVNNKRKGFQDLRSALKKLAKDKPQLKDELVVIVLGEIEDSTPYADIPFEICALGTVFNYDLVAEIYSLADVFVLPSLADNLPNTALESLACETPVVAYDSGGIVDIVDDQKNGYLAEKESPEALAAGIEWGLNNHEDSEIKNNCRRKAEQNFDTKKQAEKYLNIFKNITASEN